MSLLLMKKLNVQIDELFKRKKELNTKNSKVQCETILEDVVSTISKTIEEGKILDMDQLQKLWNDTLDEKFEKKKQRDQKKMLVWRHFYGVNR